MILLSGTKRFTPFQKINDAEVHVKLFTVTNKGTQMQYILL